MMQTGQTQFQRPLSIFVRNNGTQDFVDRYNGEDFTIEVGGFIEMPPEAAKLCLGLGEEDKHRVIRRLGWAATEKDMETALERLGSFSFHSTEDEARGFRQKQNRSSAPAVAEHPESEDALGAESGSGEGSTGAATQPQSLLGKIARVQANAPA